MKPSNVSAVTQLPWVTAVRPSMRPDPGDTPGSSDGTSLGVERLHEQGITGEGAKIGIIDAGFDPAVIDGTIQARTSFRSSSGDSDHGTAVAQVVTRTAPESQLYLASADTMIDHERAISYLVEQDVDIIVYSIGWPQFEDDGDHVLTDDITAARQQGTLFVVSAGNYATRHWQGEFRDTDQDDFLEWTASGDEGNAIPAYDRAFRGGTVSVYIRWEDQGEPSAYRAALYNPEREEYVAVGNIRIGDTGTNRFALLSRTIQSQPIQLVIQNYAGPADDEIEVVVTDPQRIERNIPASSVSVPADVPTSVGTGAYIRERGLAVYSSRGPTDDNRRGVAVTGYTNIFTGSELFGGTSAAAPYVGGVAALVEDRHEGDASPAELETALTSTSDDIRRPGPDPMSGTGVVNASAAVGALTTPTPGEGANTTEQAVPDITITAQPAGTVRNDTTFEIAYQLTNTGGAAGAFTLTVPDTPANLSVDGFSGDVRGPNPDGSPPSTSTTSVDPGQRVSMTVTYRTAQAATGTGSVTVVATPALSNATDSATTTVEIGEPTVPSTPRERALQIADVDDPAGITQDDITTAITRRDRGQATNGLDVTQDDITTLITLRDRAQ